LKIIIYIFLLFKSRRTNDLGNNMPINSNDIESGWLFKTPNNQERIVLGFNSEGKVVYASRGGNVQGPFAVRDVSSVERFTDSCSERLEQYSEARMSEIVQECNAQGLNLVSTLRNGTVD
jgi:hypothetical protein